MTKEEEIRKRIKELQRFYMEGVTYLAVNALLILIWITLDKSGSFWPKYVILVWGIVLIFKGYRMDIFPIFFHYISFMSLEWEEKKIKKIIGRRPSQWKIPLHRNAKKQSNK